LLLPVLGFGALCAMSCSHITAWEVVTVDRDDPGSLLNAHPRFVRRLSWFDIALGLSALSIDSNNRNSAALLLLTVSAMASATTVESSLWALALLIPAASPSIAITAITGTQGAVLVRK
jgi:hypothetical protein